MDVLRRPVSPLTVAGIGAVAILALIGMALHPPNGRAGDASSARGGTGEGTVLCPGGVDQWEVVTGSCPPSATGSGTATPTQLPGTSAPGDGRVSQSKPVIVIVTTATGIAAPGGGSPSGRSDPGPGQGPNDDQDGNAGAGNTGAGDSGAGDGDDGSSGVSTVACPAVEDHLPPIPAGAAADVQQNLTELRQQISEADDRLAQLAADPVDDPNFVANTVLGPLRDRRISTLDRIAIAIGRFTTRPTGLEQLAACSLDNG